MSQKQIPFKKLIFKGRKVGISYDDLIFFLHLRIY